MLISTNLILDLNIAIYKQQAVKTICRFEMYIQFDKVIFSGVWDLTWFRSRHQYKNKYGTYDHNKILHLI